MIVIVIMFMVVRGRRVWVHRAGDILVFGLVERWRHVEFLAGRQRIKDVLLQRLAQRSRVLAVDLAGDCLAQAGKVFKTKVLAKLVIDGGLALFTEFLDGHLEHGRLAGKMRCLILLGEGHVHVAGLAGLCADKAVLKARDEAVGAELQRMPLGSAALERLAVDAADEVDHDDIAGLCGALGGDFDGRAVAVGDVLQRLVDFRFTGLERRTLDVELCEVGHGDGRHDLA